MVGNSNKLEKCITFPKALKNKKYNIVLVKQNKFPQDASPRAMNLLYSEYIFQSCNIKNMITRYEDEGMK